MSASKKQTFLHGALILAVGTALVKVIGALFKVPLGNLIGPVGMTDFSDAYYIYNTLFVISTAGLPVAVSKMISEAGAHNRQAEMNRIFRVALTAFVVIGVVGSLAMFFGARQLAEWMNNPDAYYPIMVISPAVLFVAIMSAFRGYYQGQGNMYPTAISQVIEALVKLFAGYGLAYFIYKPNEGVIKAAVEASQKVAAGLMTQAEADGVIQAAADPLSRAAAGAIAGVMLGTALGALYMILSRRKKIETLSPASSREARPTRAVLGQLMRLAIPITISSSILTLSNVIDASLVKDRLMNAAGFSFEQAKEIYGALTFAQTLFNLPPAFILTMSVSVIPAISAFLVKKDRAGVNNTVTSSMRITCLLAMPAAAGLSALSYPILNLLYGTSQQAAVLTAAPLLRTLGVAVFFVCLVSLTNAILQSLGKVYIPIMTMLVGGGLKIAVNYVLVGNPNINIEGAPIGTLVCYAAIALLNLSYIGREIRSAAFVKVFVKPLIASASMGVFAYFLNGVLVDSLHISAKLAVLVAIAGAVVVYFALVLLLRALPKEDVLLLPKGEKLVKLLKL